MPADFSARSLLGKITRSAPVARLRQSGEPIRYQDFVEGGHYVVRADLPGLDPSRDIDLTVERGKLEIRAVRRPDPREREHAGATYGLYRRVMRLHPEADGDTLSSSYDAGVLRVTFDLPSAAPLRAHGN